MMRRLVGVVAPAIAVMALAGCGSGKQSDGRGTSNEAQAAGLPAGGFALQGSVDVGPASPQLVAVDPMAYVESTDVLPARPFLYSVDRSGITITRFNDDKVVGTWPWPTSIWIELPDGSIAEIPAPAGGWEPVAMTVSAPTEAEVANRVKEIPDLTPPWTFVYVVMARSGYEWRSVPNAAFLQSANVRDLLVPSTSPSTESSILVQIDVSDPSFSASRDPVAPVTPHIAGAILGHGAGQPVYDRRTGNVYVGNAPSTSLPAGLTSFVSVIHRIPPTVTGEEAEVPGISKPVIRCGPQHPEAGIPVGRPQAFACYDPSGNHPIDDNEHVGAFGRIKQWDPAAPGLHEQFVWEFRNLPTWLTPHHDKVTGEPDGILYGTPPEVGEWYAEARVHNLGDEYGVFSDWTPVRLLVTPTAEYLPIKAQFAAGVPVAYPLEGTGACALSGAPAWIDVVQVPNGCVVMGRAPISGERYDFAMPGFAQLDYPTEPIVFNGDVVGAYNFDPLPEGVALSGLAWHQVEKVADPSTETPVLTGELIGVEPSTGQLYRILQAPGQPQPPNERPAETAIAMDTVSTIGAPLGATVADVVRFGEVAVEADRDIFVSVIRATPDGALIKVPATGDTTTISLAGVQPYHLSLESDLRPAIVGVEPGQVDNGILWVTGSTSGNVAVVDTAAGAVAQTLAVPDATALGGVSVDFGTRYAYVAGGSLLSVAVIGPAGSTRPPMAPRIWSSEEFTWNRGFGGSVTLMATGDPIPTLAPLGELPSGLTFVDNGDGTATVSGTTGPETGGDYAFAITATNATGTYAQAFGIGVNVAPTITSGAAATFTAGSASSFQVTGTGSPTPILFTWAEAEMPAGVQLIDNEDGTASLVGTPEVAGTYVFEIQATTSCPPDASQTFTLTVNAPGTTMAPVITSGDTATWATVGAPFPPDPIAVTSTGSPTPALSISGDLPDGVEFRDNGDSTGTLLTANGGLMTLFEGTQGTYTFTIHATNSAGTTSQTFTLVVEPNTSIMTPGPDAPATLSFAWARGGTLPEPLLFPVGTLGDTMPYAAVTTAAWLEAAPVSGMVPGGVLVSVIASELAKLAAGTYTGTVLVTSAATEGPFATALVTLTVSDVPLLAVAERTMSFEYNLVDGVTPPPQTVLLTSGGVPMSYSGSVSADWLSVSFDCADTRCEAVISADPSLLDFGTYVGTVTIASPEAANDPQTITVILTKSMTKTEYSFDVSYDVGSGPEGIALNPVTQQLYLGTSNEPAVEPVTTSDVETPEPVNPAAGYAVFHFDPSTKKVMGRTLVHSQGEYVAVNGKTNRIYHASQGTGEIAVIDGRTDQVIGFIPLLLDEGPYVPYQMAIDEAQNFIYVGAHAPPIPDPDPRNKPFTCMAIHEMPDDEYDCWNPGRVLVIDGTTNRIVASFLAGDDPEGVVFAAKTGKVYASNEDDGSVTVARGAIRLSDGRIEPPKVLSTIIRGEPVPGWWQPDCDAYNYCGERGQAALWPQLSSCNGIDDEAEEADKMAVDPHGNVYIIDDRYRVAKIDSWTDTVVKVLEIPGFDCEVDVPAGSDVVFRNTANNIAFSAGGSPTTGSDTDVKKCVELVLMPTLYVTSEQSTVTAVDPDSLTIRQIITVPGARHLDAIAADRDRVFVTDEALGALWLLKARSTAVGETPPPSDGGDVTPPADGGDVTPPPDGGDVTPPPDGEGTATADGGKGTPAGGGGGTSSSGCSSGGLADVSVLSLGIALLAIRRRRTRVR